MGPHVNLGLFLQQSGDRAYDPLHGHSFHRVSPSTLTTVQHSRLFFRDCLICHQRVLTLGKANARRRCIPESTLQPAVNKPPAPPCLFPLPDAVAPVKGEIVKATRRRSSDSVGVNAENETICQCLDCGNFVHRECLSQVHAHRKCRGHEQLLLYCPQSKATSASVSTAASMGIVLNEVTSPVVKRMVSVKRKYSTTMTISALIDELSDDRHADNASHGNDAAASSSKTTSNKTTASTVIRRAAPFLAAGGVLGAIAMGPAAGVIAGLNVLVAGMSMEGMVAGLGFTAATAAATASHQIKKKHEKKRLDDELKSGAWAMQICWEIKQRFRDTAVSDDSFRKDAEFLRRFQLPRRTSSAVDQLRPPDQFAPSKSEVYALLFGIFASSTEFLSQINAELARAFMERYSNRHQRHTSGVLSTSKTIKCKETLQDARMYVAHVVGATMQSFPSLSSTDAAVVSCSQAVERVVFDDIYKPVMGVLDELFADENVLFYASLEEIRRQQSTRSHQQLLFSSGVQHSPTGVDHGPPAVMDEHLCEAERKLVEMMELAKSPMHKLELLCTAFRALCCFADKLHQTAANADILIPIVCAVLVASSQFTSSGADGGRKSANFVSQIAFTSYFTDGGGKGVEGYVLTTFQAALQVIAAVDLSQGPAQELELFAQTDTTNEPTAISKKESHGRRPSQSGNYENDDSNGDDDDDEDEFFDAKATE